MANEEGRLKPLPSLECVRSGLRSSLRAVMPARCVAGGALFGILGPVGYSGVTTSRIGGVHAFSLVSAPKQANKKASPPGDLQRCLVDGDKISVVRGKAGSVTGIAVLRSCPWMKKAAQVPSRQSLADLCLGSGGCVRGNGPAPRHPR